MRNESELADYFIGYHLHHIIVSGLFDSWTSTSRQILHKIVAGGDIWHALCVHCFLYRISLSLGVGYPPSLPFPLTRQSSVHANVSLMRYWNTNVFCCGGLTKCLHLLWWYIHNYSATIYLPSLFHDSVSLTFLQFISCFISLYLFIYNAWQPFTMIIPF